MKTLRWLLPFTHGVDMKAIDYVVHLAESGAATLVAVSLISVPPDRRSRGVRLEHIQQSKDFLEAVKWKAARFQVPVEHYEVYTDDVIQSIATLIHDLDCDSIILVSRGEKDVLLHAHELKHLLEEPPTSLMLIRLPVPVQRRWQAGTRFLSWLHQRLRDDVRPVQDTPVMEEAL